MEPATQRSLEAATAWATYTLGPDARISAWSLQAEKLFGFKASETVGQSQRMLESLVPRFAGQAAAQPEPSPAGHETKGERWSYRKDGSRFWSSVVTQVLYGEHGESLGFVRTVCDLTQERLNAAAFHTSEASHRRLVEDVEEYAIFMIDPSGKLATWNRGVERMLGYGESAFINKPCSILFTSEDQTAGLASEELRHAAQNGQSSVQRLQRREDGSQFWATCVVTLIRDSDGSVAGFSKVMRDNTERQLTQEALRQAHDDLEQRVIERTLELSQAVDLLEQQLIEREHLEAALLEVAENERERLGQDLHDGVCQQLTGTAMLARVMCTSLIRQGVPEAAQAQKIVELIGAAVDQARDLAKGLHPVSIHSSRGLLAALEELTARTDSSVHCQLHCPTPMEVPPTVALHLYRIAQEAVQNALKHANAHNIHLTLDIQAEELILEISDDGSGLDSSQESRGGMGLLNLQYRARAIGARLSIESSPGQGTRVCCAIAVSRALKCPQDAASECAAGSIPAAFSSE